MFGYEGFARWGGELTTTLVGADGGGDQGGGSDSGTGLSIMELIGKRVHLPQSNPTCINANIPYLGR